MKKEGAGSDVWSDPAPKGNPAPRYPPAGDSRSTLADGALDFRVRNGNGYFNPSMGTGKSGVTRRCDLFRARPFSAGSQMDAATRAGRRVCGAPLSGSCARIVAKKKTMQATRGISIGRLNALPRLRRQPIEVVVSDPP